MCLRSSPSFLKVCLAIACLSVVSKAAVVSPLNDEDDPGSAQLFFATGVWPSGKGTVGVTKVGFPPGRVKEADRSGGGDPVIRHFFGRLFIVNGDRGTLEIVNPSNLDVLAVYSLGASTNPQDVLLVSRSIAYITRYESTHLLELNLRTGETRDVVDLSVLADDDGIPEMVMMERFEDRLFIQIQRMDRRESAAIPADTGALAVVDLETMLLVDAEPGVPGVQGIDVRGPQPRLKMQVFPEERILFVSACGEFFDNAGGIAEIDLDTLKFSAWAIHENDFRGGSNLSTFWMVSPTKGFVILHTDLAVSSHLFSFARGGHSISGELYVTLNFVKRLEHDPVNDLLYFPEPQDNIWQATGLHIFDAVTDQRLTLLPVATEIAPRDLVLVKD